QDLLDAVKHCWLKWLKTGMVRLKDNDMPALVVKEVMDSEVSVEFRRKDREIRARAVFGLPEGLHDPTVSSDIFEFTPDGNLERMEMRSQNFQYIMKEHGPSRVEVSHDFNDEEKLADEMISSLGEIIEFMKQNAGIVSCTACFISSRPIICSASLMSEAGATVEMPPRERSLSLLEPVKFAQPAQPQGPVVATKLFLNLRNRAELGTVTGTYLDGILVSGNLLGNGAWKSELSGIASETKRLFTVSTMVIELGDTGHETAERLADAMTTISEAGMQPGILVPGIRSAEELARVMRTIRTALEGLPEPSVWVKVMYPSNLFFMESLAAVSDVLLLDLDSLARLMLGADDGGDWLHYSIPALEGALETAFQRKSGTFAILSDDLVSTPSMLEFLVRHTADIICVGLSEVHTVKHIIASVEKRILLEEGRA
ncbi:MAG: hypothetical protein KKD98_03370, partial [Candidatus Thermoplasmatota archaeon]|nr:hypothetical protein [Candidatus Thermoplasmatota archaeon]